MSLKCLIVDDEPNAVNLLEMLVGQNTNWEVVSKCYNAIEALTCLKNTPADLIFLDINMPQLSGIELAGLVPPEVKIVFTTAYSEFAAESYNFQTIDYLMKPITLKRFLTSMQKIEGYFSKPAGQPKEKLIENEYFFVKSGKVIRRILLADILYFEGEKEYVRLVTPTEQILIYRRLKDVEEQVGESFIRVHNSYIVNLAQIAKIQDNHIHIGAKQIPISDKFRGKFNNAIEQRIF